MVPREHVYHIEGCQFITEIHILKVRLKMSELLIFSPFFNFFYCFFYLFIYLFSYLFIIIIHYYYYMYYYYCLFFRFYYPVLGSGGGKKQTKKHQIPSASLTVLQFVEGLNMKKQIWKRFGGWW